MPQMQPSSKRWTVPVLALVLAASGSGVLERVWQPLMCNGCSGVACIEGRQSTPTAAIIDSQSVRAAETVATAVAGFASTSEMAHVRRVARQCERS